MNPKRRQRLFLVLGGVMMVGLAVGLILFGSSQSVSWFKHPSDIANGNFKAGQTVRVGGVVKADSFKRISDSTLDVEFIVTDCLADVKVTYDKILPDLFREGQSVVAEGQVSNGVLKAVQVLAKHDENYVPPEASAAIKAAQDAGADCTYEY